MRLDDLLESLEPLDLSNVFPDMEVTAVVCDSRQVVPGCAFLAIAGEKADGHEFIDAALERGATVVVQSRPLSPGRLGSFVRLENSRRAYALMSARLAGNPSQHLRVIGVTGTNGKTSTALMIAHLLESAGYRPAVLGTLGLRRPGEATFESTGLTTPDAGLLQQEMATLVELHASHLVMEVSSHSLEQDRVYATRFSGGVFTNLSQDHLDYHLTMDAYKAAKALLFAEYLPQAGGYAVVNIDDAAGREFAALSKATTASYGQTEEANLVIRQVALSSDGSSFELVLKNGVWPERLRELENVAGLQSPLVGLFNVYNCTAAIGCALLEGLTLPQVGAALASFSGVPGRLQRIVNRRGVHAFVDYAHTPDALDNVLAALQAVREPGSRIVTVFGCGGDRDRGKRPRMAAAARRGSDLLVVTSDNPRGEEPDAIIAEILGGLAPDDSAVQVEPDRRKAIRLALGLARPGDIVLVAGKGHEDYQILAGRTIHFSDAEEIAAALA